MDHIMENKFLNKEKAQIKAFHEDQAALVTAEKNIITSNSLEGIEFQVFESFIKEKFSLLGYFFDLVLFCAKKYEIPADTLYSEEILKNHPESRIKNEAEIPDYKNRVIIILEKYQEQSAILDPILEQVITPVLKFFQAYIRKSVNVNAYHIPKEVSNLFEIVHWVCKVRGYKTVIKFFPHEVADMEPVVEMLHFQETDEWWISYTLILWLSIIVLVPFDIDTIDSKKELEILVKRIINICKNHMSNSGKIREATSVLLSKLLTRPDVIRSGETDFFLNFLAVEYYQTKDDANQMFLVSGILSTLTEIFKIGHREDLIKRVDTVFDPILKTEVKNKFMGKSTNLRMFKVKLAQRIGCIFLKPKVAKWRYQRGFRSLLENLKSSQGQQSNNPSGQDEDEEMEDEDINYDQLEYIIQYLLESLKDEDNKVRWNAAKGLGRITGRMTKEFADQIVEQLFALFDDNETENAWHGGCLALAELCRRGLLLPERLTEFVPSLEKALIYDINRGNYSVGANVRDAACYVVWSFARAYAPEIMKPHVHALSTSLIVVSLFDREVNCRRAASATFQECVGRQGTFPHGIEILTEADYFTLSNRVNAYLNVSCFVAQFPEYFESIAKHLAFIKLRHWEPQIRELSAQALSVIAVFNPEFITTQILPQLIDSCLDKALHVRHGAIFGVSEILVGLSGNSSINRREVLERAYKSLSNKERKLIQESEARNKGGFVDTYTALASQNQMTSFIAEGSDIRHRVKDIIEKVDKNRLYRGKGGEIMRIGVCHLVFALSLAQIPFKEQERLYFFKTLLENFKHPNIEIQEEATKAYKSFCQAYFSPENKEEIMERDQNIMKEIKMMLKPSSVDENVALTRGYNMSFGVWSKQMYQVLLDDIFDTLIKNCIPKGKETDDAETRKQAVRSLISAVKTFGLASLDSNILNDVLTTLYQCLNDYQVDRRGDVGSWVREESMLALKMFLSLLVDAYTSNPDLLVYLKADHPHFYERFIQQMLQQLSEKIDKVREIAGRSLQEFFQFVSPKVQWCEYAERDQLTAVFLQGQDEKMVIDEGLPGQSFVVDLSIEGIAFLPWRSADFVFRSCLSLFFDSPVYSPSIFKGLITSSGGLTESTLKASTNAVFEYLSAMNKDKENGLQKKKGFLRKLISLFEENLKDERVTIPLMKTLEILLGSDYLSDEGLVDELKEIHALTVAECNKNKNIVKLMSSAGVFSGMFAYQDKELLQKAIKSLLFLLYHSFPKVRKLTSEKLYTALLTMEDYSLIIPGGEDDYEGAMNLISETNWTDLLKQISHTKEQMYAYFGMQTQKQAIDTNNTQIQT